MERPIELVLLTGFLGSGKTTLMNALLSEKQDTRTAILVNEFGKVGVDGALLRRSEQARHDGEELTIYEVADGSIFCTCKTASFVAGLRMFARMDDARRPERIIVEASGMSDPSGLSRLLRENRLAGDYVVASVVCLVDAVRFPKLVEVLPAVRRQVEAADLAVVNKIDLVDEEDLVSLETRLREINGRAKIVRTSHGRVTSEGLWSGRSGDLAGELVSCSTPATRPAALLLAADDIGRAEVERFLTVALGRTYRIKGWLNVDGRWFFISDNSGRIEWRPEEPPAGATPGLTVICSPEQSEISRTDERSTSQHRRRTP